MKTIGRSLIIVLLSLSLSACSTFGTKMKSFLDGGRTPTPVPQQQAPMPAADNMYDVTPRAYGRMTAARMEQEAHLDDHAGSLWVGQGQGAYLFSENTERLAGDLLNVKLDGAPREQLETKARVIRDLLHKIEMQQMAARNRAPASKAKAKAPPAPAAENSATGTNQQTAEAQGPLTVDLVPTRVVERMPDGNYRVEGSQSFMIGRREYRVLVAGVVRPQDFNDDGVSATRLLDPRFDIIGEKKGAK